MPNFSKLSPVTVILALLTACGDTSTINEANLEEVARGIHERVITLDTHADINTCLLYTSPSPRDGLLSRMPSSA